MRFLFCLCVAFGLKVGFAQNKQVLYGLEEVPQSLLLNPGVKVPQKMHFGIPFLSHIHLNAGASGISTYDIFGNTGEDINDKIERKIFEMKPTDFFTATQQWELLNFGWRSKRDVYFSGGVYQEFDFISYFPKDLAILAWEGNANYLGYEFDLGELSTRGDLLTVYHFGANKQLTNKLTLGIRAKVYSSILSVSSTHNQGTFVTTEGGDNGNNIYQHTIRNADVMVQTSGIVSLEDNFSAGELIGRSMLGGNLGIGLDIGATYDINSRWTATASVLDVGTIFHANSVESYHAYGDYTLEGIELIFPPLNEGQGTLPYYDNLEEELEQEIPIDTLNSSYSEMRPVKMNASLQYRFGKRSGGGQECDCRNKGGAVEREQVVGLQYFSVFRPKGPQMAGTLFYQRRLFRFLSAKATYTIDSYSSSNIGLGVVGDLGKFNFYVAADNIQRYGNLAKAKSVSLQLGFNIKFHEN
tara:strand:- start:60476 stop:61882 length:1407 start_codon:yes stop_codon:yes gene_type:complete